MKFSTTSLLTVSAIAAFSLLLTTSCKKSNNSSGGGGFSATVSGTGWASTIPTQAIYDHTGGIFELVAGQYRSGDTTGLSLAFSTPFTLHTAFSSDTAFADAAYINVKTLQEYDGGNSPGHTVITVNSWDSVNHKISGTFSGVLYNITGGTDSVVVTNGSFNTAYTAQ